MSKSPVCDGQNFISGLEATYRGLWRRYCKGDVPSLRYMEMLKKEGVPEGVTNETSEPERVTISKDTSSVSIESNGFSQAPVSTLNLTTSEVNENQSSQTTNSGNLS